MKKGLQIAVISLLFILISCCPKVENSTETTKILREVRQDTIFIHTKPEITYISDTIIETKPFIFRIDTILKTIYQNRVKTDTIKVTYSFPENDYKLSVKSSPDSLFTEIKKEIKTVKEKSFFDVIFERIYWLIGLLILLAIILYILKRK